LGTVDLYTPGFSVTDVDDEVYTIAPTESDDTTEDYSWADSTESDKDEVTTDSTANEIPLESLMTHIDLLAEQDGIAKGQYVYTDKTGRPITVVYVAGPSSLFKAYTAGE
jgi:hypothetical protein